MQVIPAIDLLDGKPTRLTRGDPSSAKRYGYSPLEVAQTWVDQGAKFIHVIDLDAALGRGSNTELIRELADNIDTRIQVGGGVRTKAKAEELLGSVDRVILGSMPFQNLGETVELLDVYGSGRIVIALDHRDGYVAVKGWQETTEINLESAIDRFKEAGFTRFLVTNVNRDGTFDGPDTETYRQIAGKVSITASGGVSCLTDIQILRETGVEAVIVGKALYENRFTYAEAEEAAIC